jgi:hypothetical protein
MRRNRTRVNRVAIPFPDSYRAELGASRGVEDIPSGWYERISQPRRANLSPLGHVRRLAVLTLVLVGLNLYAPANPPFEVRLYGTLILATVALPVWLWNLGIDPLNPSLSFVCLIYAYYYALPVFLLSRYAIDLGHPTISTGYIVTSLKYAWIGMLCMLAGYYGPLRILIGPMIPRFDLRWTDLHAVKLAGVLFSIVGLVVVTGMIPGVPTALGQLVGYAADLCMVGIFLLFTLQLVGRLDPCTTILLWGVFIPIRILSALAVGSGGGTLIVGVTLAIVYATVMRRIPWLFIVAGTAFYFVMRPLELPYRIATWGGQLSDASKVEKLTFFADLAYKATVGGAVPPVVLIEAGSGRLAMFTLFAEIIRDTPSHVPYWGGESYYPILFKPIPRALWPGKPAEVTGQSFGHRYGIVALENQSTSVNLPQTVEMYANFGLVGVVLGMLIVGLLYRMLGEMFVHPGMGIGALVASVFMIMRILDIGSAASMVLGSLPWNFVFIGLLHLMVRMLETERRRLVAVRAQVVAPGIEGRG